jgi:hypothetical protein
MVLKTRETAGFFSQIGLDHDIADQTGAGLASRLEIDEPQARQGLVLGKGVRPSE